MKKRPFILGIAGGTGSGKTTIAHKIKDHFNHNVIYIPHDRYYKDQSDKSMEERVKTNYDHPDAVDVPSDIRILRRTKRDIEERGRTLDSCYAQYVTYTRPMHEQFVEPTKEFADIIVPRGGKNEKAVSTLIHTIEKRLKLP